MCVFHTQDFWLQRGAVSVSCRTLFKCSGAQKLVWLAFTVGAQSQPLALAHRGRGNTSMEINVVTQIKSSEVKPKRKARMATSVGGLNSSARAEVRRPRKPTVHTHAVEYVAYAADQDKAHKLQKSSAKPRLSHLVARGKDLVSGDAASVATAAVIVVGAALIEVELIPGLIIGTGAVLLGKLFPEMSAYVRPAIKGALRAGISIAQKAREAMAEDATWRRRAALALRRWARQPIEPPY